MSEELKAMALKYNKSGLSVIPLHQENKIPLISKWERYGTTRSTEQEVKSWWNADSYRNIGIACGPANGKFLFVVDQDIAKDGSERKGDISGCPPTLSQTTGSGGKQLFYWAHAGYEVRNGKPRPLVDIRGLGGQVVVPPSIHPNGNKYSWDMGEFNLDDIQEFPLAELETFLGKQNEEKLPINEVIGGLPVGEGLRHMGMAQVAGHYLRTAKTPEQIELARLAVYEWDRSVNKSPEPLAERRKEIDSVFNGILKSEIRKRGKESGMQIDLSQIKLWSIADILTHDFGEQEWVVESLIPKQGMTAFSGNPGDFKTWITIHVAISISRGVAVFGKFPTTQAGVLVIDEEDHLRVLKKRLKLLGATETDNIHYLSQNGIKMDDDKTRDAILDIIKEKNIKLLILDSLVRVHSGDENDAKSMAEVFSSLQKIISAGASVLFTHHHRKQQGLGTNNLGQSMRGSSDILAVVDCHMMVEKKKDEPDRLIIRQPKLRQAEALQPFEIKVAKGELGPSGFEYVGGYDEKKKKAEEVADVVIMLLKDGMKSRSEIQEILLEEEFGKTAIDDGIKLAEGDGKIERVPSKELTREENKRKAYYRLPGGLQGVAIDLEHLPASHTHIGKEKQEDEWAGL